GGTGAPGPGRAPPARGVPSAAAPRRARRRGAPAAGEAVEARLLGPPYGSRAAALLFGAGDWRMRTEDRPPPPRLAVGDRLQFAGLAAAVASIDAGAPAPGTPAFDPDGAARW